MTDRIKIIFLSLVILAMIIVMAMMSVIFMKPKGEMTFRVKNIVPMTTSVDIGNETSLQ